MLTKAHQIELSLDQLFTSYQNTPKLTPAVLNKFSATVSHVQRQLDSLSLETMVSRHKTCILNLKDLTDSLQEQFSDLSAELSDPEKENMYKARERILETDQAFDKQFAEAFLIEEEELSKKMNRFEVLLKRMANVSIVLMLVFAFFFVYYIRRTIRHIHNQKDTDAWLRKRLHEAMQVLNDMPTAIAIFEAEGETPVYINNTFKAAFEVSDLQKAGEVFQQLETTRALPATADKKQQDECRWKQPGKKNTYFIRTKFEVTVKDRHIRLVNLTDISPRKRFEKKLRASEKQLKKDLHTSEQFISIISHDIRSPLSGILGLSEVMHNQAEDFTISELAGYSAAIHRSTDSLLHLVNNLLDWSKMRTGRLPLTITRFNLRDLADTVLGYYFDVAGQKKVRLENKVDAALEIEADENMLNTVLRNLVSNALKFTGENGEITISAFQQQNKLVIRVADTGQGMDAAQLKTLFSRKKYESGKGGLGLLLCKEMVAKHKGTIQAESAPGKGTAFTITLPARQNRVG